MKKTNSRTTLAEVHAMIKEIDTNQVGDVYILISDLLSLSFHEKTTYYLLFVCYVYRVELLSLMNL